MREHTVSGLILLLFSVSSAQTVSTGWQIVKDSGGICQIAVPPDWTVWRDASGAAVFHETNTAIAIVTSQPGQDFRPLTASLQQALGIPKQRMFENSARRIFYQDRVSESPGDPNAYSVSVPGKTGSCSGHVTFLPSVNEDTARKIALSLGPAAPPPATN
jgi:hypothetical protein